MDRRESPGVRHLPHPHAVSGDAAVPSDGSARPHPPPRLDSLRHRPCRLSTEAYDSPGTRTGICLDLPAPLLSRVHLAPPTGAIAGHPPLPGDVVPLQALQSILAPADQTRPRESGLEAAGRNDPLASRPLPPTADSSRSGSRRSGADRFGGSLT